MENLQAQPMTFAENRCLLIWKQMTYPIGRWAKQFATSLWYPRSLYALHEVSGACNACS